MTINDIAELCGLSKSTVSRYLTGGSVSKKSSAIIARVIEETGFELNVNASRLRGSGSKLVGVLVDGIQAPSVTHMLTGINERLQGLGYQPFIMIDRHDEDNKVRSMQALVRQGVDGLVFGTARLTDEHVGYMRELSIPVLVVGQESESFPFVKVNDLEAGRIVGEHVLEARPSSVVYLSLPRYDAAAGVERERGFRDAFNGVTARVTYIEGDYATEAGYALGPQILEADPDFVVCASDSMAYGAMRYLMEQGLCIPQDVRMASFGNFDADSLPQVSLTSFGFDYHALGRDAAGRIVDLIAGKEVSWSNTGYAMELHVRRSSGEVAAEA